MKIKDLDNNMKQKKAKEEESPYDHRNNRLLTPHLYLLHDRIHVHVHHLAVVKLILIRGHFEHPYTSLLLHDATVLINILGYI